MHVQLTSLGSLFKHIATNSLKALLKFPVSSGGLFLGIRNKTLMGWRSELGGSPLASSMAVIPRDQISAYKRKQANKQNELIKQQLILSILSDYSSHSLMQGADRKCHCLLTPLSAITINSFSLKGVENLFRVQPLGSTTISKGYLQVPDPTYTNIPLKIT